MHTSPTGQPRPSPKKHRRRWPWITGAVVLAIFVLAGIFGNKPQSSGTPGTVAAATSSAATPTTVAAPPATTTLSIAIPPAPAVTTVPPKAPNPPPPVAAPPPIAAPPPVDAPPVVAPPVAAPPPVAGRYHAGEFCSTLGATTISTNGDPMTCIQEGKYKRWHND